MRTVALVPLRGGSRSIPYKNIRPMAGRPLCSWALDACLSCPEVDEVYVSTEDERIRNLVSSEHPDIRIIDRPKGLAQDATSTEAVMLHFADQVDFDLLVMVQATSPLTTAGDISMALSQFKKDRCDSMLTAVEFKRFLWERDGTPINYDPMRRPRRQEFEGCMMENGAFYITRRKVLLTERNRLGGKIGVFRMADETAAEIDEPSDWEYVERLLLRRRRVPDLSWIRMLAMDVDGTLTDGGMYYTAEGDTGKKFNTRDGKGIEIAREKGIEICILTAESSEIVKVRARKLEVAEAHIGVRDKLSKLRSICRRKGIGLDEVLYIGDDLNDLECIKACGSSACPADSAPEVISAASIVCKAKGGQGVVREVVQMLMAGDGR